MKNIIVCIIVSVVVCSALEFKPNTNTKTVDGMQPKNINGVIVWVWAN